MTRPRSWMFSGGLVALGILVVMFSGSPEPVPAPAHEQPAVSGVRGPLALPVPIADHLLSEVPPAPGLSSGLGAILLKLRGTFGPGGSKPNRFRLERELSTIWGDAPPVGVLLHEATDPTAPPDYREHFARRLLNLGKVASPESREELAGELRAALASAHAGATGLASALISIDDSPANIRAVDQLFDGQLHDLGKARLVAALTLSHAPEASAALLDRSRVFSEEPDRFPRALSAALPPLVREPGLEVEPVLQRVVASGTDLSLFETAIRSCFVRRPGDSSFALIRLAHQRRTQFGTAQQERIAQLLRAGLLRWQGQSANSSAAQRRGIDLLLKEIS